MLCLYKENTLLQSISEVRKQALTRWDFISNHGKTAH